MKLLIFLGGEITFPGVPSDSSNESLKSENARLRTELTATKESVKMLERIVTAGLRREDLPEDEKKE